MPRIKSKQSTFTAALVEPAAIVFFALAFFAASAQASDDDNAATTATATAPSAETSQTVPGKPEITWWIEKQDRDAKREKYIIGSLDPASEYLQQLEVLNTGAAVYTLKLSKYYATVTDKKLAEKHKDDYDKYLEKRYKNPEKYKGHYSLLNPVGGWEDDEFYPERFYPLATKTVEITIDGDHPDTLTLKNLHNKKWRLESKTENSITLSFTIYRGPSRKWDVAKKNPVLKIKKTYTVNKKDYSVGIDIEAENLSSRRITVRINQSGPTGLPREDYRGDMRKAICGVLDTENGSVIPVIKSPKELKDIEQQQQDNLPIVGLSHVVREGDKPTLWIGHINKFFGAMMHPIPAEQDSLNAASLKAKFYVGAAYENMSSRTFTTGVVVPKLQLGPDKSQKVRFSMYAGPKKTDIFDGDSPYHKPIYKKLNYKGTIEFGGCCCTWEPLSFGMMWLLDKLSVVTFDNYGLAIILLVVMVRMVLHPLTRKSQKSMSGMQKLAPQMQKIKEKHKDDKEALNREMMKFYKQHGASPFLGCLPMFLQMPIWIALWTGINASVNLRHAGLLPVWITDLAAPDTLIGPWETQIMFIGNRFNLLPILLGIAMFLQSKLNPQMTGQSSATPDQQKQQQMMRVLMPVMMLFIFYNAPSGLTLYIMASTFAGAAEMYVIRKHIRQKEELQEAIETTVTAPGKAPRSKRPKKPKGPFWTKHG